MQTKLLQEQGKRDEITHLFSKSSIFVWLGSEAPLVSSRSRFQLFLEFLSLITSLPLSYWSLLLHWPSYECLWLWLLVLVAPLGPRGVASC